MRKITAAALVICLFELSILEETCAAESTKEWVNEFGTGAQVNLKLATGEKIQGSVETLNDEGFLLNSPKGLHSGKLLTLTRGAVEAGQGNVYGG